MHGRGTLFGLNPTHTRGDIYCATLEGIALDKGQVVETCRDTGAAPVKFCAVSGGIQNRFWSQATSNVPGQARDLWAHAIGASYGDAFLAAITLGDTSLGDIDRWNLIAGEIVPEAVTRRFIRGSCGCSRRCMHRLVT